MKDSWLFVVNPVAGGGKGLAFWDEVQKRLNKSQITFEHVVSGYHKHAIELVAEKYNQGVRHFMGIGGDGTLNEMVNGIFKADTFNPEAKCVIGLLPVGTGNDWVRGATDPLNIENIIARLDDSDSMAYDVGLVKLNQQKHYFLNVAGAGLDGQVVKEIEQLGADGKKGKVVYLKGLISALFNYTAPNFRAEVDGELLFSEKALLVAASKGAYFGGGMHISPDVLPDNGALEFTLIKKVPTWRILRELPKLFNGRIAQVPFVIKKTGKSIYVESQSPLNVQADGEYLGEAASFSVEILPAAIHVLR